MKYKELEPLKEQYDRFRKLLFNDDMPAASEIEFKLHSRAYAMGYSMHRKTPLKNGKIHVLAFCKYYKFTEREKLEVLIHEMIHIWQVYHVKEDRYKLCSDHIAHDRVFEAKMNTINLMLEHFDVFVKVSTRYMHKLNIDKDVVTEKDMKKLKFIKED